MCKSSASATPPAASPTASTQGQLRPGLLPIEFQGFNAKGFGDYTAGFAPTCRVADNPGNIALATRCWTQAALTTSRPAAARPARRPVRRWRAQAQTVSAPRQPPAWAGRILLPEQPPLTATGPMQPLRSWPAAERARIAGVLTDIDDTLTTEGAVTPDVLQALAALARRPARDPHHRPPGGLERTVRAAPGRWTPSWPRTARWRCRATAPGTLRKLYTQDEAERAANFARMQQVAQRIVREVPGATLARDSGGRETDIAIDHSEFTHLPQEAIDRVVALMRAEGMNATVSSIHVNGWYGGHNKLAGARWMVRELLGRELEEELDRWVYVGDSTNDVLMFEHFPHSVGWPTSGASRTSWRSSRATSPTASAAPASPRWLGRSSRPARPRSAAAASAARPSGRQVLPARADTHS